MPWTIKPVTVLMPGERHSVMAGLAPVIAAVGRVIPSPYWRGFSLNTFIMATLAFIAFIPVIAVMAFITLISVVAVVLLIPFHTVPIGLSGVIRFRAGGSGNGHNKH